MKITNEKILVAIIIIGAILRLAYVPITPIDGWETDSTNHALLTKEIVATNQIPVNDTLQIGVFIWYPPAYHFLGAFFYNILPNIQILQIISSIFGIMTIPLAYLTFKKIVNERVGLLAALFLAIYPLHFRLSTTIMTDATSVFFTFLSLYVFVLWEKTRKNKYALLLAGSLGLLLLSKFTGFVILGIFFLWKLSIKREQILKFIAVLVVGLLIASPWYLRNYAYSGNPLYFNKGEPTEKSPTQVVIDALRTNPQQYFVRFWDTVQSESFIQQKGISVSLPYVNEILLGYLALSSVYFLFFALGFNKSNEGKLMIIWLLAYAGFSIVFLTSNWGIGYVPRVTTFAIPMFCYLFAVGANKLLKYKIVFVFLVLTSLMFFAFVGFRLYTGYKNERNFFPGYDWIKNNVDNQSVIVSIRGSEVSMFSGKKTSASFSDKFFDEYKNVYTYGWKKDIYSLSSCPKNYSCTVVYQDEVSIINKVNHS